MNTAAARFLSALVAPYPADPELRLEIRPLWPEWKQAELYPSEEPPWYWRSQTRMRQWFPLSAPDAAAHHALRAAERIDVYMGVLPRLGRKGGQADVPVAAWLWADVDGGQGGWEGSVALVKASGLPVPHLAVMSGGGVHAYWRLTEAVALSDDRDRKVFKELLQRLCRAIGGEKQRAHADSSRADSASILRVPGTANWKRQEEPREVRLLRCKMESETQALSWWDESLPPMEEARPERPASYLPPGESRALPPSAIEKLHTFYPPGTRHEALRSLLATARGYCGFDYSALEMLAETFATKNNGRLDWARKLAQDTYRRINPSY